MWLMTTQGFYSVVADRDDRERLLVRARTRADIEALRAQIPELEPFEDRHADYRWRAFVPRERWREALAELSDAISYDNFKNAVKREQGSQRAALYAEIWSVLARLAHEEPDGA